MAVNSYSLDRLIFLIKQSTVNFNDIKIQEYKDATIAEFKSEVANGSMTAEQYKQYTGLDYTI